MIPGGEEYNDEVGMIKNNLHTLMRACKGMHELMKEDENMPEWVQEKVANAKSMMVAAWDYMISQHEEGQIYRQPYSEHGLYESKLANKLEKALKKYT